MNSPMPGGLASLLAAASGDRATLDKRGLPEAQIARLRETLARARCPNPFNPGDLITPRRDATVSGAGDPHVVMEIVAPTTPAFRSDACCGEKRFDARIAYVARSGNIHTHWIESWEWEPWQAAEGAPNCDIAEPLPVEATA